MSAVALLDAVGEWPADGLPIAAVPVATVPLVVHAARNLIGSACLDLVLIAVTPAEVDSVSALLDRHGLFAHAAVRVMAGCPEPVDTVAAGLALLTQHIPAPRALLLHDVRRAFAPPDLVQRVVAAVLAGAPAVVPVLPCSDTVKRLADHGVVTDTPDRSVLRVAQTPQGFAIETLRAAYRECPAASGADPLARLRRTAHTVVGHPDAYAVRSAFDVAVAEATLTSTGDPT